MREIIEFQTEHLFLRQWQPNDYACFAALNADPRVMEFFPSTLDKEASDMMADRCGTLIAERGWGFWAAELRETKQFIGFVGLHTPSPDLPISPCVEIGWRLAFEHWGKGYASEAAREVLNIGFNHLKFPEIVAFTSLGNRRSRAVMQRIGMIETTTEFDHPAVPEGNPHRRHCLYSITSSQWANKG